MGPIEWMVRLSGRVLGGTGAASVDRNRHSRLFEMHGQHNVFQYKEFCRRSHRTTKDTKSTKPETDSAAEPCFLRRSPPTFLRALRVLRGRSKPRSSSTAKEF